MRLADGARQALETFSGPEGPPDCVLIEASLALDGEGEAVAELIERAAGVRPAADIILLADGSPSDQQRGWREKFRPPFTVCSSLEELTAHMYSVLEKQRLSELSAAQSVLDALLDNDGALNALKAEKEALDKIVAGIRSVGFDRVRLYVMSEDGSAMSVAAHVGMPEGFADVRLDSPASLRELFATPAPRLFKAGGEETPDFEHFLEGEGVREWVCMPLLHRDELIGLISADAKASGRRLRSEELRPLQLFAAQARTALVNNLIAVVEEKAENLQSILQIYTSISSTLHLDNILKMACRSVLRLVNVDQCWLMLLQEDFERGTIRAAYPKGLLVRGTEVSLAGSKVKQVVAQKKTCLVVADFGVELAGDPLHELLDESRVRSCLVVPVISKGHVIGAFGLDCIDRARAFSDEEVVLCQVFAAQLAVAIENAQLYSAAQQRAAHLESLRQVTMYVTSAQRLEKLLRTIIEHAVRLLKGMSGGIYESKDGEDGLHLIASYGPQPEPRDDAEQAGGATLEVALRLNKATGVLRINDTAGRRFTPEESRTLGLFADQASVAIERAELIEQLDRQQKLFDRLVSNMPNGLIAVDTEGVVMLVNPRARQILGYGEDDKLPEDVNQIYYHPDEGCRINEKLADSGKKGIKYQTFARGKDGSPIPIRLYVSALVGASNRRVGSVGYFEDLRHNSQAELLLEACGIVAQPDTAHYGLRDLAAMLLKLFSASFCRILMLDVNGKHLTVEAAHSVTREGRDLDWNDRLYERSDLRAYAGLKKILYGGAPKVIRLNDEASRPWLEKYSAWLGLASSVQSLLLIPLVVGETVVGLTIVGELRAENRTPFTKDKIDLAAGMAGPVAALIDRRRLQEETRRRHELLTAITERVPHIRGDKEPEKLLQEFVRLAAELVGYQSAGLYTYHSKLDTLELSVTYPAPAVFAAEHLARVEEEARAVARKRLPAAVNESSEPEAQAALLREGMKTIVFVPLKLATGEVEGVLFAVADKAEPKFIGLEVEALGRFVEHTAGVLQTSRLMDLSQRTFSHLRLLQHISEYVQEKPDVGKAVDVMLTGITAGYGLGYNRAVMIMRDQNDFYGFSGIGHMTHEEALDSWDADHKNGRYDFKSYITLLEEGRTFPTPIGERIRDFRVAISEGGAFLRVVREREPRVLKSDELGELPSAFLQIFGPASEVALIPFIARGEVKGLIVADNKFTQGPITRGDVESLLTFAGTVAIATDNIELQRRGQLDHERLRKAQNAARVVAKVTALEELSKSLRSVVAGTMEALNCNAVTLYTYDDDRKEFDYPPEMIGVQYRDAVTQLGRVTDESVVRKVLKLNGPCVAQDTPNHPLLGKAFAEREGIASSVATRLTVRGRPVGVMFVNFKKPHEFTPDELTSIELFASQAAVAIRNKQLYREQMRLHEQEQKRAGLLEVLYEAGRSINSSLNLDEILGRIAEHAWKLASYKSNDASFVHIKLVDGSKVRLVAAYPPEESEKIHSLLGKEIDLEKPINGRIGVVGRAITARESRHVPNVDLDPDYVGLSRETKSQSVVLITRGTKVAGVISAEHPDVNAFDEETINAMELLAAQASIAIENAKQFEELGQERTKVNAQTSLALMGMASSIWGHDISGYATTILNEVELLRRELPGGVNKRIAGRLDNILKSVKRIHEKPVEIPCSTDDVEPLLLNEHLETRLKQWSRDCRNQSAPLSFELAEGDTLRVRIQVEWLRRVFDIPLGNSVKAMEHSPQKRLVVTPRARDGWAEISIADTGPGIAPEVLKTLLWAPIVKPKDKGGLGRGLLMARTILQAYGGDIEVGKTDSAGTTMVIRLPLAS